MQVAIQYYRSHGGEGFVVNETFELVDKVADCKSLFDELEGTLAASWDIMFEQAKKYYDENGNLIEDFEDVQYEDEEAEEGENEYEETVVDGE